MMPTTWRRRRLIGALTAILLLTGCATASAPEPALPGVEYGADKAAYAAAFATVDPITLRVQSGGPEGSLANTGIQAWADAVEEWSAGKITFEIGYGYSFVPNAVEWAAALGDGRLDAAYYVPYFTPEIFPALSQLASATSLAGNQPADALESAGWLSQIALGDDVYQQEAHAAGLHILAAPPTFNLSGLYCPEPRTSLADFEGTTVSANGAGQFMQVEALGATAVTSSFTELYEALQRGVVTCAASAASTMERIGTTELTPWLITDPEAGLADFLVFFAMSKETWDDLPLVAQQLLYDRMDAIFVNEPRGLAELGQGWFSAAVAAGGGIAELDADAHAAFSAANEALLDDITGGTDGGTLLDARARWREKIRELYPELDLSMSEFLSEDAFANTDLQPYSDALFESVLLDHRPR